MIKDPITSQYSVKFIINFRDNAMQNTLQNKKLQKHYIVYNKINLDVMGINLQGNILYIKRSSGLVPMYNITTTGGYNSGLGVLGGNTNNQFTSASEYIKQRENTISKVICVRNMVTLKELEDVDDYEELYDDVKEECKNYGKIMSIKIPRPEGKGVLVSGLGKVFIEYMNRDGAVFARDVIKFIIQHLNGKSFHGKVVDVVFHPEDLFKKGQLD